ncbi:MAG: glucokinase [Rhodocyclaceae bacterium]|nr:glucokinase [Rhodocyclaceae bacterium]
MDPCLVADIGGTNARFALTVNFHDFFSVSVLPCGQYPGIGEAMEAYLSQCGHHGIRHGVMAIATPVLGDQVQMTNHHWSFSVEATRARIGLDTFLVLNDFSALAMALPFLGDGELVRLDRDGESRHGVKAVIGPGTGLGVAGLVPVGDGWQALATEGGHVDFAPSDRQEMEMLKHLWREYPHVSAERLVSGPGIALMYRTLCELSGETPRAGEAAEVVALATDASCPLVRQALGMFSGILGGVAGDLALTFGARGGVYLGGGILGKLGSQFDTERYRERFLGKGRFRAYLEAVPNYLITAEHPAFVGAARFLRQHLAHRA